MTFSGHDDSTINIVLGLLLLLLLLWIVKEPCLSVINKYTNTQLYILVQMRVAGGPGIESGPPARCFLCGAALFYSALRS